jgi:hypothetical protein
MDLLMREPPIVVTARGVRDVCEAFADEMKRKPTSREFFEILTWALKGCRDDLLSDVHPARVVALIPKMRRGATTRLGDDAVSAVAELNDNVFVVASDFLSDLAASIKAATGTTPTLGQLCETIVQGLHKDSEELLSDISPIDIVGVTAKVKEGRRIVTRIGDIVAIPAKNGEYSTALILDKNAFGTAYGLFEGTSKPRPVSLSSHPPVVRHPIYSGDEFVAAGRWRIVGHDEALRSLFPREPEIYHRKQIIEGGPTIGPYGAGETASGRVRQLSREEAEDLGVLSGEYQQVYTPEELESYLNRKLQGHREGTLPRPGSV